MTKNTRVLVPSLMISLVMLAALTYAASRTLRISRATKNTSTVSDVANLQSGKHGSYLRRSALAPKLEWNLNAMGDRLEKPGRERLRVTGTLARANDSEAEAVDALLEFPDRLRLSIQKGAQNRVITFDGSQEAAENALDEQDVVEMLVYDTPEHFFSTQMLGHGTRLLGSRFRLDDGFSAHYGGPYYDVYQVADRVKTSTEQPERLKLYYFNSDTLLMERVTYDLMLNGSVVKVEERIGDWTREQGQQVPRRFERFEDGKSVFVLTIDMLGLGPRVNDRAFGN